MQFSIFSFILLTTFCPGKCMCHYCCHCHCCLCFYCFTVDIKQQSEYHRYISVNRSIN